MNRYSIKEILEMNGESQTLEVSGWVKTIRSPKAFSFIELNDGSIIKNLQIVVPETISTYASIVDEIHTGASIFVKGSLVPSMGKNQKVELQAQEVKLIGKADPEEYPLQKKQHSFEYLREIAHLRPRTNTFGAVARVRSALSFAVHQFFQERGFTLVHTPILTASDCEGAGEMFQVTTLPLEKMPFNEKSVDYSKDFFGKKTSLTVSGQLEGETYATALGNIYTFGPTFRAEHSNTTRHLAEFWMIEPEMAFCDLEENSKVAESFLKTIINAVLQRCPDDMDFFNERIDKNILQNLETILKNDFVKITYTEAVDLLLKSKAHFEFPVRWGDNLQAEHEKFITEQIYQKPVVVTDYPKEIKAFYMKLNDDFKTVRAMDILVPRLGEIIGGSQREEDYTKLLRRIREAGLDPLNYWWYLELRKYGTVPHSGFGLGFERLIQFITGMQNIRDVIPYPRSFKNIDF